MVAESIRTLPLLGKPHPGRRLTEAEFLEWCDSETRAEWVDGEVIMLMPNSLRHMLLVGFLYNLLSLFVRRRGLGQVVGGDLLTRLIPGHRWRIPDLLFVAAGRVDRLRETFVEGAPDLVVEVVSDSSESRDWREKFDEYEAAGVGEYWVVSSLSNVVEVYGRGADGRFHTIPPDADGAIHSAVVPGFWFKPAWLREDPLPDPLDVLAELGVLPKPG